jgi:hypothetical protein
MRGLAFSLMVFVACGCGRAPGAVSSAPPNPEWDQEIFKHSHPLENIPAVGPPTRHGNDQFVTVTNTGKTVLVYLSGGPQHVQLFQEVDEHGKWRLSNWDWCGTGKETFELNPGQSVELAFRFWDAGKRERMLAHFTEKGTFRSGMVVLAAE